MRKLKKKNPLRITLTLSTVAEAEVLCRFRLHLRTVFTVAMFPHKRSALSCLPSVSFSGRVVIVTGANTGEL